MNHSSLAARHPLTLLLCLWCATGVSSAAQINYSGTVESAGGSAIAGARVWVAGTDLLTYSDDAGEFVLEGETGSAAFMQRNQRQGTPPLVVWRNGLLQVPNPQGRVAALEVFTVDGRRAMRLPGTTRKQISVRLGNPHDSPVGTGVLLVRVTVDDRQYDYKLLPSGGRSSALGFTAVRSAASARATAQYDLSATAPGYHPGVFPQALESASGLFLTLTAQTSDSLERFQIYYEGCGAFPDLSTGQTVTLPMEERLHVAVFGEGYTVQDLSDGKYESDLARWYNDVFVVTPMDYYREAFVIWKYPVASNEHVIPDGAGDTYFQVRVVSGSVSFSLDSTAAITWRVVSSDFPYFQSLQFYPSGGNTSRQAKNMTVSFMIYNPSYGRTGYSGVATSLANPDNSSQRLSGAFALGHQHEFMHAMAKLRDEYYDRDHTPVSSSTLRQESGYITNVVCCTACDSLPWQHLLYGGEYNPGVDSLVGAFGTNGRYHPELKCLINGSHENSDLYGGSNNLRTDTRLCNWCRELAAFRIHERCMVLDNTGTSWDTWVSSYRAPFYSEIGFNTPSVVPQENSVGTAWFLPCGE